MEIDAYAMRMPKRHRARVAKRGAGALCQGGVRYVAEATQDLTGALALGPRNEHVQVGVLTSARFAREHAGEGGALEGQGGDACAREVIRNTAQGLDLHQRPGAAAHGGPAQRIRDGLG